LLRIPVVLIENQHRHGGRGREMAILVTPLDVTAYRATHGQPHDDFDAFGTAKADVVDMLRLRERHRILFDQIDEAHIPLGIVVAGSLAVNPMRQGPDA
jgi:hypothetical protein